MDEKKPKKKTRPKKENLNNPLKPNITFEGNHILIREAFIKILRAKQRAPQLSELRKETGLSFTTLHAHIKSIDFKESNKRFGVLSDDVMMSIYKSAMDGSATAQKLWIQVVGGWSEKYNLTHSGEITQNVNFSDIATDELKEIRTILDARR